MKETFAARLRRQIRQVPPGWSLIDAYDEYAACKRVLAERCSRCGKGAWFPVRRGWRSQSPRVYHLSCDSGRKDDPCRYCGGWLNCRDHDEFVADCEWCGWQMAHKCSEPLGDMSPSVMLLAVKLGAVVIREEKI